MHLPDNILHKIDVLNNLTPAQVDLLLEAATPKRLYEGEILFAEGSKGNCLYVVLQGTLTANIKHGTRAEKKLATISAGASLGEVAMLTGCERTATMQAISPCLVMQITKEAIQKAGLGAVIYQNIARMLAERLAKMNEKAARTVGFAETFVGYKADMAQKVDKVDKEKDGAYDKYGWLTS